MHTKGQGHPELFEMVAIDRCDSLMTENFQHNYLHKSPASKKPCADIARVHWGIIEDSVIILDLVKPNFNQTKVAKLHACRSILKDTCDVDVNQ